MNCLGKTFPFSGVFNLIKSFNHERRSSGSNCRPPAGKCLILEDILSSLDIRSACATSLKATDELLSEIKPAVVLIDQHLPDGHGFRYIPKIKRAVS